MKRLLLFIVMTFVLFGCSTDDEANANEPEQESNNNNVEENETNTDIENVSDDNATSEDTSNDFQRQGSIGEDDFNKIFSDAMKYEGYEVTFNGKVFVDPEHDADGVYLQVFADPENHEKNIIVAVDDADFDVEMGDYVHVDGVIVDEFEGANAYGGQVVAPVVLADDIEVIDYEDAISPALETIKVDATIDQHGYEMYVEKVEIAENMTRLYVRVMNNTDDNIMFYSFNSNLLLDNKQLEEEIGFYEADFPEVQSEILPGVESEGIIVFPAIDPDISKMTFHAEGSSDNYDLDFEPFVFEITK